MKTDTLSKTYEFRPLQRNDARHAESFGLCLDGALVQTLCTITQRAGGWELKTRHQALQFSKKADARAAALKLVPTS